MPKDMSRRNFLKGVGKAAAGAMMPKGAAGKLIEGLTSASEDPIASNLRMNQNIENASMSPMLRAAAEVFKRLYGTDYKGEDNAWADDSERLESAIQQEIEDAEDNGEHISQDEAAKRAVQYIFDNAADDIHDSGYNEEYIKDIADDLRDIAPQMKTLGLNQFDPDQFVQDLSDKARDKARQQAPKEEEPLVKSNRDLDEKALQQKFREDIERKPRKGELIETPWEHEPQEGASASLGGPSSKKNFINPFTGGHEPEPNFPSDELDRLYGKDVNDQLIDNRESKANAYLDAKRQFLKNRGYEGAETMTPEQIQEGLKDVVAKSEQRWRDMRDIKSLDHEPEPLINPEQKMKDRFKELGYSDRDIDSLSSDQLQDLWDAVGKQPPKSLIDRTNDFLDQYTGFGQIETDPISEIKQWAELRGLHLTDKDSIRIRSMIGDGMTVDEIKKELLGDEESEPLTKNNENLIINNKRDFDMNEKSILGPFSKIMAEHLAADGDEVFSPEEIKNGINIEQVKPIGIGKFVAHVKWEAPDAPMEYSDDIVTFDSNGRIDTVIHNFDGNGSVAYRDGHAVHDLSDMTDTEKEWIRNINDQLGDQWASGEEKGLDITPPTDPNYKPYKRKSPPPNMGNWEDLGGFLK